MKKFYLYFHGLIILTIFFGILLHPNVSRAGSCDPWVAKAVSVQGRVEVRKSDETRWQTVRLNDTYCAGDVIRVKDNSRADLDLVNQPVVRLDENTTITLGGVKEERTSFVELLKGAAHFFSRSPRSLEVSTAFVNAGVEGTEFFIRVAEDRALLTIFEGKVLASNKSGDLMITSGQSVLAEEGKAPVYRVVANPRDAVQWALYYPPLIYSPTGAAEAEAADDPRFLINEAAFLLSVGRVQKANANIEKALQLDPGYSDAYALQTIIAIVGNEKDRALSLAREAVDAAPQSATAHIALSYAQQARFEVKEAGASLEKAVELEPQNALAWARLAEIRLATGYLDQSLKAAKKAAVLDPELARTHTVLGFARLTMVDTEEARAAFERAIALDQADSLPRLGLGLARIREGEMAAGGREIEIAASLGPNNAIIRSYLGKLYYEEKQGQIAGEEYAVAKELDPKDPTPWFYDAIAKQTANRPVEALHNMQKAIDLNDNRAVYRSRLLLDSDLAARSASLARIYNDLGFQQLALVEGWKSVNIDPTNFSAHRFLADSYSARPRHEIARVSELLQSQLLQPINITPIQPRLAESNLFLLSAQGPVNLSFNEFSPLFNRNRIAFQGSGLAGSNDTWGGEGVLSGIYGKFSLSTGYSHFETDGWRQNAYQDDDIANFFVQTELTPKTSIQGEYRRRDTENGDIELLFWEDNVAAQDFYDEDTESGRFGFRHTFSPQSTVIGNFMYSQKNEEYLNLFLFDPRIIGGPPPPPLLEDYYTGDNEEDAYNGEIQHLFRSEHFNTVAGAGYFSIDQDLGITEDLFWPGTTPPLFIGSFPDEINLDIEHYNLYLYSDINLRKDLTLTLGTSGDFFKADDKDGTARDLEEDQFNPKLGVTYRPLEGTTLRGAVFRTLKRTLITDQTLEPTQVAGFNQFFDDVNATKAWVYGAAVDQKFSKNLYGGLEFYHRDIETPYFGQASPTASFTFLETDWEEYVGRPYIYWTPHKWVGLRLEYLYEKFERTEAYSRGIREVETHAVPLGIEFFHPSGFSAGLKATYYDQEGEFVRKEILAFEEGEDEFWVVDASLSYRLPKRNGFFRLGVSNLFDREFNYAETDADNPRIQPERSLFCRITLALP